MGLGQGRIIEFKPDRGAKQHSMKVQCYLHSKCSVWKRVQDLPESPGQLMQDWLLVGLSMPNRNDANIHLAEWLSLNWNKLGELEEGVK